MSASSGTLELLFIVASAASARIHEVFARTPGRHSNPSVPAPPSSTGAPALRPAAAAPPPNSAADPRARSKMGAFRALAATAAVSATGAAVAHGKLNLSAAEILPYWLLERAAELKVGTE